MVDVVDQATRSRMMAGIRGKHTRPEVELRKELHALGFRFRLHVRALPGSPDIVLPRWKAAVFVQGCFWHRHEGCRYATNPATRPEFWQAKFKTNVERDNRNQRALSDADWRVVIVWECAIRERGARAIAQKIGNWMMTEEPTFLL